MNPLLPALITTLTVTIFTEFAVFLLIIRKNYSHLLLYAILINGFTNPLLNYLYLFEYPSLMPLEIGVVLIETILIHLLIRVSWRSAFVCSLCANTISLISGSFLIGNWH